MFQCPRLAAGAVDGVDEPGVRRRGGQRRLAALQVPRLQPPLEVPRCQLPLDWVCDTDIVSFAYEATMTVTKYG